MFGKHVVRVGALVLAMSGVSMAAASLGINGSGQATTFSGVAANVNIDTFPDIKAITISGAKTDTLFGATYQAAIQGTGASRYGSLSGQMTASGSAGGASAQGSASGSMLMQFADTATVTSATLAPGTPVSIPFTVSLTSTVSSTTFSQFDYATALYTTNVGNQGSLPITGTIRNDAFGGQTPASGVLQFDLLTQIGQTVTLAGNLSIMTSVRALAGQSLLATVEAGNTAVLFYSPVGDVRLVSESGHDYLVPEPATLSLLALGSLLIARRRRP